MLLIYIFLTRNNDYIDVNEVRDVEPYPPMITERRFLKVVYLKSDIYVFSGLNNNNEWT